jgi:hypothetical protein
MKYIPLLALLLLPACSPTQQAQVNTTLASPAGQLFCSIQTSGGGQIVASVIDATASAALPGAAPAAVLVTNMSKGFVDAACAAAAASAGGTGGVAVSPPATGVPVAPVAIVPPVGR